MSFLKLAIREDQTQFRPGEMLQGVAGWQLDQPPTSLEVRLYWQTQGKGTEDVEVVERMAFDQPQQEEARAFQFALPPGPYSFAGKLISLQWGVELVAAPSNESARLPITLSPTGAAIQLSPSA